MKSVHNRTYVPGSTALIKGRIQNGLRIMPQESIELLIEKGNFLVGAPFLWISMSYRYGTKNDLKIKFQGINKKYGDLDIALELNMEILKWADQNNLDLLRDIYMISALEAVTQVGHKYKLPTNIFESERAKYGNIPNTIEECINYNQNIIISHNKPQMDNTTSIDDDSEGEEDLATLIIEYPVIGMGNENDLKKRYAVQDLVHKLLNETDLGYCDGGNIGSGAMEVCCFVTDYQQAHEVIKGALKNTTFGDYSKIYKEE
jgi:hypothetical protein